MRAGKHPTRTLKGKPHGVARVANKLLGIVSIATHSSNLGGWVGEKSKALKLEGKERFEPQAATQQLRAPV